MAAHDVKNAPPPPPPTTCAQCDVIPERLAKLVELLQQKAAKEVMVLPPQPKQLTALIPPDDAKLIPRLADIEKQIVDGAIIYHTLWVFREHCVIPAVNIHEEMLRQALQNPANPLNALVLLDHMKQTLMPPHEQKEKKQKDHQEVVGGFDLYGDGDLYVSWIRDNGTVACLDYEFLHDPQHVDAIANWEAMSAADFEKRLRRADQRYIREFATLQDYVKHLQSQWQARKPDHKQADDHAYTKSFAAELDALYKMVVVGVQDEEEEC